MKQCFPAIIFLTLIAVIAFERNDFSEIRAESVAAQSAPSNPELVMQTGHGKTVEAVVISPDNRWIGSGSFDNSIKIWEFSTGRELRSLIGHTAGIRTLAVSPDGQRLASGGNDKTIRIWNVASGKEIMSMDFPEVAVEALSFNFDGTRLASGGTGKTIIIWETESGRQLANLSEHNGEITALAFSRDGRFLASGSSDQTVKIWDVNNNRCLRTLKKHTGKITTVAFSPNGENLASGSADNTVRWWKISNGRELFNFNKQGGQILALALTVGGKIVSINSGRAVSFDDPTKGNQAPAAKSAVAGLESDGEAQSAAFSQDGRFAATGNGDGTVDILDAESGAKINTLENHTSGDYAVAFSDDRRWLVSANFDNTIKLWDLQTGQKLPSLRGHTGRATAVVFHPDNQRVISASMDGTIKIWDAAAGTNLASLAGHQGTVNSIAVGNRGRFLVSGGIDHTVRLWDLEKMIEVAVLTGHSGEVVSVSISLDEQIAVSAGTDRTIKLWDLPTRTLRRTIENSAEVYAVALSSDKRLIAAGDADNKITVWETATGRLLKTMNGHAGKIYGVKFSPDAKQVASGSRDNTVRLWSVLTGEPVWVNKVHTGAIFSVAFSADGRWLASASEDGSVTIGSAAIGKTLVRLVALKNESDWLVAAPEGFFDGSPAAWEQILWRFGDNTFSVKPVEIFFREFYLPGLLAKLLNEEPLPTAENISIRDRRQPTVKISLADDVPADAPVSKRQIKIKVRVAEIPAETGQSKGSGVRDVRLFRNGSLVKLWAGDAALENGIAELETDVSLVKGQNQFVAYAYNDDNIKSGDAFLKVGGGSNLERKGIFYIVTVGISEYGNSRFNLKYTDADAQKFAEQLSSNLAAMKTYERIEIIPLLNREATKKNILTGLRRLAGNGTGQADNEKNLPPSFARLQAAEPEDSVAVFFSGHGKSKENHSYILPFDMGFTDPAQPLTERLIATILSRSISDTELEEAFRGIDAKNLILILDACESGDALKLEDQRQAPINNRGLGQLAYDKGMYIITASQGSESAYVSETLQRSYLSYALVEQGLKTSLGDTSPKDGQISIREWFDFAVNQVPQLRRETNDKLLKTDRENEQKKRLVEEESGGKKERTQRPRVFYRRQNDLQPLIVSSVK